MWGNDIQWNRRIYQSGFVWLIGWQCTERSVGMGLEHRSYVSPHTNKWKGTRVSALFSRCFVLCDAIDFYEVSRDWMRSALFRCVLTQTHTHTQKHQHTQTHTHTHTETHRCTHTQTYMQIHTHTHGHCRTHTQTHLGTVITVQCVYLIVSQSDTEHTQALTQ
jgi:hypothetical protein